MLKLRLLCDNDVPLIESWLNKEHVKRWYEIPHMNIFIDDWMYEIRERNGEFKWLTYLIVECENSPIGFCQYYKCIDSDEDYGALQVKGSYGIDYLIGKESYLGKGLGKEMVMLLVNKVLSFTDAQRVTADIDSGNTASQKTLLSCGFELFDAKSSRYVIQKNKIFG